MIYIYIYICVCVWGILQSRKSRGGTIPSGQINYSNFEYLNIPGKELTVNRFTEQILFYEETFQSS